MRDLSTPIWQLTLSELKEFIESIIANIPQKPIDTEEEVIFNTKEAAAYLKVSISTLNRWNKDYLKSDKKGGIRRYRKSELDKILSTRK